MPQIIFQSSVATIIAMDLKSIFFLELFLLFFIKPWWIFVIAHKLFMWDEVTFSIQNSVVKDVIFLIDTTI